MGGLRSKEVPGESVGKNILRKEKSDWNFFGFGISILPADSQACIPTGETKNEDARRKVDPSLIVGFPAGKRFGERGVCYRGWTMPSDNRAIKERLVLGRINKGFLGAPPKGRHPAADFCISRSKLFWLGNGSALSIGCSTIDYTGGVHINYVRFSAGYSVR
jgi:hypothetical protein